MYISKSTLAIVCIAIIAFIVLTCHYSSRPLQESSEQVDTLVWVNNAGDITESIAADPSYFSRVRREIIDSMAKVYKTTPKKIIEYVVVHESGESDIPQNGTSEADYFTVDTSKPCPPQIKSLTADFVNPYDSLHVKIAAPGSGDSSYAHKVSKDTLTMLEKWVTEGNLFNRRRKLQFDFSNANPDNKIYIDHAYRIYEKPKRWAIGFSAGYGLPLNGNVLKPVPFVGITITKTVIRF